MLCICGTSRACTNSCACSPKMHLTVSWAFGCEALTNHNEKFFFEVLVNIFYNNRQHRNTDIVKGDIVKSFKKTNMVKNETKIMLKNKFGNVIFSWELSVFLLLISICKYILHYIPIYCFLFLRNSRGIILDDKGIS